ncbi:PA1571 family protein [Porticoccus sp.]|uniref:PA1571 family protein n=1 Tax=Porticoccus sp. TaxID=2024853 RepID=UPI000C5EB9DB|nr:PA1571 family protein [Porticoccus sp.]MAZ69270.1 hypothetical protein [Porticoccus sp.]|tara:strand:- start:6685 stop:6870 length:186 start_codon:yes stop_codon:yes gene_type:complete
MEQPKIKPDKHVKSPDFHGAALIDDNGREIPITEDMVQDAFSDLDQKAENHSAKKPSSIQQ